MICKLFHEHDVVGTNTGITIDNMEVFVKLIGRTTFLCQIVIYV